MSKIVTLLVVGGAAYVILGLIRQSQYQSVIASCGGPLLVPSGCPALVAYNQRWKWYPQLIPGL